MSETNPVTGQPYGGRDEKPEGDQLPGERETDETQDAPSSAGRDDETASRAATEGAMSWPQQGGAEPSPGIPGQVQAPGPEDATGSGAPGGSAANQSGRTPDHGSSGTL